jgi:hypothetical protein
MIASDGTLIGGNVVNNAPSGPTPTPRESIAWTIGTSIRAMIEAAGYPRASVIGAVTAGEPAVQIV